MDFSLNMLYNLEKELGAVFGNAFGVDVSYKSVFS